MSTFGPRQLGVFVVALLAFLAPYTLGWAWGWWKFAGSCIVIVLLWRWARPKAFMSDLGIRFRRIDLGLAVFSLLVVGIIARHLIPGVVRQHGYVVGRSDPGWMYLAVPFQTLNEEMVLRALLLTSLAQIVNVRLLVSATVAAVFVALHFVLYRFGPPHALLSVQALATLLLAGLAFNEFFLARGNIAVPFAIHLGWNLTRFGNDWIEQSSGDPLPQGTDFNLIEGNSKVIALAMGLSLVALATRFRSSTNMATLE
jgi:membrane protease YdiL (CAAX protease family)